MSWQRAAFGPRHLTTFGSLPGSAALAVVGVVIAVLGAWLIAVVFWVLAVVSAFVWRGRRAA